MVTALLILAIVLIGSSGISITDVSSMILMNIIVIIILLVVAVAVVVVDLM